jgi:hypothetical protein
VTGNVTIFPTFASLSAFLVGIGLDEKHKEQVRKVTLDGEGPIAPVMSYDSSWKDFHNYYGSHNFKHLSWSSQQRMADMNQETIMSVSERVWEASKLLNLREMATRNLRPSEHIPG